LVETMVQLMYDYVDENPKEISEPDFHEIMLDNVREIVFNDIFSGDCKKIKNNEYKEELIDEISELLETATEIFYIDIIPPRSYPTTFVRFLPNERKIDKLQKQIDYLKSKPQPDQRTPEWYKFRHNLITASNAYKAFENQNTQNQLIYEKCQPLPSFDNKEDGKMEFVNVNTTLHWGQKYEPISVMIYETEYNTKVGDFGCIQHDTYSFLGASPDGINIDRTKNRFGRMLEIKNIVNREIDGIPKKEYWIQMQLQMETCDLDECDFLETKFVEYEDYDSFLKDGSEFTNTEKGEWKGIFMYFTTKEGRPKYIYKPLTMEKKEYDLWMEEKMELCSEEMLWIKNIYWKIEEISCVLVVRNSKWFQDNIQDLDKIWKTILKEREKGYSHRAPTKRIRALSEDVKPENKIEDYYDLGGIKKRTVLEKNGCLINVKGQPNSNENVVIRIRTESMDETKKTMEN